MKQQVQGFRISPQQRRLWKLCLAQDQQLYVTQMAVLVERHLEENNLQIALQAVLNRHELLRSTFPVIAGMSFPMQVVGEEVHPHLRTLDWCDMTSEEQTNRLEQLFQSERQTPFDLEEGTILRVIRIVISPEKQILLLSAPAFCLDLQGAYQVLRDLLVCAEHGDVPVPEEELPIPYTAVADWWNEMLETDKGEYGRSYWQQMELSHVVNTTLTSESVHEPNGDYRPQTLAVTLDAAHVAQIVQVAERVDASLASSLHTAWQVLVGRMTQLERFIVGTSYDGRMDEETVAVPGLFARYVPLAGRYDKEQTYLQLVEQTEKSMQDGYEWQESFSWELLGFDNAGQRAPYFPIGFDFVELADEENVSYLAESSCIDRFDVRLSALQVADGVQIKLYFDANRYSEQEMQHVLNAYAALLKHAVSAPDRAVAELGLLDESECRQLLASMHDTRVDFDTSLRLHELFEAQVERTPQQVAVTFGEDSLTYAELNLRSNQLARQLVKFGVDRGNYVGIFVERSLEMVIALLATLKSGAAYVPLDPSYPQDRIDFMVQDAQLPVLLTLKRLEEQIGHVQAQVIALDVFDSEDASDGKSDADNLHIEISAEDPAYVIYTSGTTGQPKGVVVPHRAICNHMLWMQGSFQLQPGDRVLQKTPFSFDASVWEFYAPLLAGAELVIAEPERHMDPSYLSDVIRTNNITTLQLVPTLLQMLLDEPDFATCTSLQRVFCGGEALTPELVERFFLAMPESVDLINLYGPTECCIDSTYHICEPGSLLRTVPIGKPIANAQALVLDERMEPVSVGVLGELYIGGMGVALGYLHRPELTAERFVRHVFEESSEHTQFLYKTGDQVRRLSDGNLEYVGRADDQVKVRGFRIELGEIEKVIGQYDDVREAVVIAHEYAPGDTRLVGYFVPEANAKPAVDHVRDHLKGKLPDYMVPATLVMLDELPLSPSGKVNRKALPIPEMEAQQKQGTYIAPRNPMEELLERIFGQVLHHEKVGVHDNFFDLGGHSLLATQVVSRIRNTFGVNLPLSELFSTPTIAHLAKRVQALMQTGQSQDLPLLPVSREEDLQLSYAQERLWFMEQLISASYSMPIPLRLEGTLHVPALEQALQEIVRRHETLRTTFTEKQGRVVQVIAPTQAFSLRQIDLTALSEPERTAEVERRLVEDVERAFDLTQGPLFEAQLLLLSAEEHVLLISMHHIITDGWSIGILLQELSVLYEAYASAKPALLPDLPIQYVDYAHWQRKWLQGDELERQVSYWKTQLGGELPVLQLPFDRPRPEQPSFKGGHVLFDIPALTGAKLQELSQQETATLFMTMLATYQVLLYRFSGQEDILVGTPVANRNRSEVEHLIGDFINTLVMRSHLFDSLTFRELVRSVRETALSAYANQDVPFEKLIEELQPERSRNFTPLFQVWFLLLSEEPRLELDGLTGTMIDVVGKQTKWELTLGIADRAEGMKAILEYSADLFDRDTVELMSRTYLFLLEQVAESPDIRMRDLLESIEQAEAQYRAEMQKQIDEKRKSKFKRSR